MTVHTARHAVLRIVNAEHSNEARSESLMLSKKLRRLLEYWGHYEAKYYMDTES